MVVGRPWIRRKRASWDAGLLAFDADEQDEPFECGAARYWLPEVLQRRASAATEAGTRRQSEKDREGENGGVTEHQELTRITKGWSARRRRLGTAESDGDLRRPASSIRTTGGSPACVRLRRGRGQ